MRVLMLSWEYPPHLQGGLGRHVDEIVPALSRQPDLEVHLVVPRLAGGSHVEQVGTVTVHRVDVPTPQRDNFYGGVWHVNNVLSTFVENLWQTTGPFDLVHGHDWLVGFIATALQRTFGVPLLVTIHATEKGRGRGWLAGDLAHQIHHAENNLAHAADRLITCSRSMRHEVVAYFQVDTGKIDVIPNGVDASRFASQMAYDNRLQRQMYAGPAETLVFHVGRLVHEKGAHILLEAVPAVLAAYPTTRFVIAGRGPLLDRLHHRAAALHISERVLFPGFISDEEAVRLFCVADVAVFPSLYEPFGLVALEAMAARIPLVVTNIGGFAEIIQHNVTGLAVYPEDADSLAWGICETLRDPAAAQQRTRFAYDIVTSTYSWNIIARRTVQLYRDLAAAAHATA
jgi:glycosyltransferase involved in cell wall biosynthesis